MPHPLHPFIAAARAKGSSDEFITHLLTESGWPEARVLQAFTELYAEGGAAIPAAPAGRREAARDAFYYLLAFATLGTWTISLGSMLFVFIERAFPDPTSYSTGDSSVAVQIASLIIALPVYLLVSRTIGRDLQRTPEKAESGVRKWLTYIALFVAAGVVIGDLITFLAYLIDGELTVRFALKVLSVLAIAGGVFGFYFAEMRRTHA